jgi:hypothetical protein
MENANPSLDQIVNHTEQVSEDLNLISMALCLCELLAKI